MKLTSEMEDVLDYCQDDREIRDFREFLIQEGDVTDEERKKLLSRNTEQELEVMKNVAITGRSGSDHIWAIAQRVRTQISLLEMKLK